MVNTTISYNGAKRTAESEIALAICLTGNEKKDGVEATVICLAKSMVSAVSRVAVNDLGAAHALMKLSRIVEKAAKEKCLERLSK